MYAEGYGIASWQRLPTHISRLRHYADHDVSVAYQINTNGDFIEDLSELFPARKRQLPTWRSRRQIDHTTFTSDRP